jgi:hypothetical protein
METEERLVALLKLNGNGGMKGSHSMGCGRPATLCQMHVKRSLPLTERRFCSSEAAEPLTIELAARAKESGTGSDLPTIEGRQAGN